MTELLARAFGPWVHQVGPATLRADLIAGILGALLVLPQGFAFAALAGLPPEFGLYTAIVPCVIAALFGSSWHVVSGPTNANSLALFATLAPLAAVGSPAYIQLALAVTVLVGVMQWLIGALRLGSIANFISPSALRGFMSGAAVLIALHSLVELLGLAAPDKHGTGALLAHLWAHAGGLRPAALLVAACTFVAVLALRRALPRWPNMLIGLAAGMALAAVLNGASVSAPAGRGAVAVIGSIPAIWPRFHWPGVQLQSLPELLSIAFALTIVALGQSISIAKAVAARSGQAIDANREFRGQGLSNIVGGFFSSYVSCGSLNRSLPNLEAGARTPLAAVFASAWLLLLLAFTSPLLALIPLPAIAALLLLVAWSLFDLPEWQRLWRDSRNDFAIAATTAVATVTLRIEMAILLGTILSLVTYLYRTSHPAIRVMGFDSPGPERPFIVRADVPAPLPECPQLKMIRMEGEVYFGAVPFVADHLRALRAPAGAARHLLVMAKSMNFIDLPAADLWRSELAARRAAGGDLYFHRPRPPVLDLWQRIGYTRALGADHIFPTKRVAIATIFQHLDRGICARCSVRVFEECQALPPPLPPGDAGWWGPLRVEGVGNCRHTQGMRLTQVALTRLQDVAAAFYSGKISRDAARSAVIDLIFDRLGCSRVSLWRFEGRPGDLSLLCFASKVVGGELVTTESWLRESEYRDYFDALVGEGTYVSLDTLADANLQPMRENYLVRHQVRSMLDAAFMVNGRAYGMVCCEQTDSIRRWRTDEVAALRTIVAKLALLMATAPDAALWGSPSLPMSPIQQSA